MAKAPEMKSQDRLGFTLAEYKRRYDNVVKNTDGKFNCMKPSIAQVVGAPKLRRCAPLGLPNC